MLLLLAKESRASYRARMRIGRLRLMAGWLRNLAALVLGLALVTVPLELGLRLVQRSADPRVLVYPRVATDINGFKDPEFQRHQEPGEFRILALGGSAFVTRNFRSHFEALLDASPRFRDRGLKAKVISTGVPAHMTWDSLWKYRDWYRRDDFDLVIFYHGINDARANCYPRERFRADYSHMPYYAQYAPVYSWIEAHPHRSRSFALTFFVKLVYKARVLRAPHFQREAPYNDPAHDAWLAEGADIKTAATFERNEEAVVALAKERHQRLLLLTYAYDLPEGYTHEAFMQKQLDYSDAPESVPVAIWGIPKNVQKSIEAHNDVTRLVAARHPEVFFFDMARFIPRDGAHFIDICHWTDRGLERFTEGVLQALSAAP